MPIALDPDQTYPVYLIIDEPKPEATRPAFLFRYLTKRKARLADERLDRANAIIGDEKMDREPKGRELEAIAGELMALALAGWRNIPQPFSLEAIDDVLTYQEQWELLWKFRPLGQLSESDRKKFASAARSAGIQNSTTAENAPADAKQKPVEISASESPAGGATVAIPNAAPVAVAVTMS